MLRITHWQKLVRIRRGIRRGTGRVTGEGNWGGNKWRTISSTPHRSLVLAFRVVALIQAMPKLTSISVEKSGKGGEESFEERVIGVEVFCRSQLMSRLALAYFQWHRADERP